MITINLKDNSTITAPLCQVTILTQDVMLVKDKPISTNMVSFISYN